MYPASQIQTHINMERSSILAHRGLFQNDADKNSIHALRRAFDAGFGIETDLRDFNGRIVISHDVPVASSDLLSFDDLLSFYQANQNHGRCALNIKSSGLSQMIDSTIKNYDLDASRLFAFDMSVPDAISYFERVIPIYSRISDYEQVPSFLSRAAGVWVDNLGGTFQQVLEAKHLIDQRIRVAIVSPELHSRDHKELWRDILETGLYLSPLFELCTDFPTEAASHFCRN